MTSVLRTRVDHLELARAYARDPRRWSVPASFDPDNRWYACLDADPDAEIWLLTWLPGQGTEFHDHGDSAGAFTVVSGLITEEHVTPGPAGLRIDEKVIRGGQGRRFGRNYIHRMTNRSDTPTISVHVYGPALEVMNKYDLVDDSLTHVRTDRAGLSW